MRVIKKSMIIFLLFIIGILLMPFIIAIPQDFNVNGKLTNSAGTVLVGTYTMNFSIYNNETGGNPLWSSGNLSVTTDSLGVYNVRLTNTFFVDANNGRVGIGTTDFKNKGLR